MTKRPPYPYMVKALKIFFSGTKKSDDLETWYAASGTRVLSICSYDDSGLILTYFTEMSILVSYAFVWENVKTMDFSETIVVYDIKVGR